MNPSLIACFPQGTGTLDLDQPHAEVEDAEQSLTQRRGGGDVKVLTAVIGSPPHDSLHITQQTPSVTMWKPAIRARLITRADYTAHPSRWEGVICGDD